MNLFWTFMLLMVSISWGSSCREGEKLSLLQFKEGLHDPSGRLKTWNASTNCCEWEGILCQRDTGHVVHLDLRYPHGYYGDFGLGRYASDVLSPANRHDMLLPLFNLTMLEHLDLSYNQFIGVGVPHQFHMLNKLQYLNLSNAGFVGIIPRELGNMSRLRCLDLSTEYYISDSSLTIENMQMWIGNLRDLEELLLTGVNMSLVASDEWAKAISTMYNLRRLEMSDCELSGPIPTSLANLTHLTHLQLSYNFFFSSIPARLQNLSKLVSLKLGSCELKGSIPCDLLSLPNLQEADLSANLDLGGNLPSILPRQPSRINSLVLSATIVAGGIPDSIANMSSLILLDVSYCLLQGMVPSTIANLSRLVELDISSNNFQGKIPPFGARPSLGKSFPLAYIDLSYNKLEGSIAPILLGAFGKLSYVRLNQNRLTGGIPSPSRNLTSLAWLYLGNNQLNGRIPSLANLKSLVELDLSKNLLSGKIPASIGQLFSLRTLYLSSNMLSQAIPRNISNLSKLQVLSLSSNRLSGNFSESFILNLDSLVYMDISNNMLTVKMSPTWIPKNSFRTLNLRSCNMEGELPAFLTTQFDISRLDLSDNRLWGKISTWIWDSPALVELNLSHNHFTGVLPSKLTNRPRLKVLDLHCNNLQGPLPLPPPSVVVLDLSENHFCASIPPEIGEYRFSYLSLSHNNLSGRVPSTICDQRSMQILDLSYNRLAGKIPVGYVNCSNLEVLNLEENFLEGHLPAELGNMSSLQTLKINRNRLNGVLPVFANCTELEILDVGDNDLTGNISSNWLLKLPNLKILILRSNRF